MLHEVPAAVDAVHDLEVPLALVPAHPLEETHETIGLGVVAHGLECREGERGVAQPHKAIVPVAASADGLRQRRGGCRDDGAGVRMGEELERERRTLHLGPVGAVVAELGGPDAPERGGDLELVRAVVAVHRVHVIVIVAEHQPALLALHEDEARRGGALLDLPVEGTGAGEREHLVAPVGGEEAGPQLLQAGGAGRIREARHEAHGERDHPAGAADLAVDFGMLARGPPVDVHRHEVDHLHLALVGAKGRLQHVGAGEISLPRGKRLRGRNAPGAAPVRVEDGGKHAAAVEPGQATPVDGAGVAHQRGGAHVADQAVVADGGGQSRG